MKKDPVGVRLNDAMIEGHAAGFKDGVRATLKIVYKYFHSDWTGEAAIREIKKLLEEK